MVQEKAINVDCQLSQRNSNTNMLSSNLKYGNKNRSRKLNRNQQLLELANVVRNFVRGSSEEFQQIFKLTLKNSFIF